MKNLLAFTAFLAAGYLVGCRRARKAGPISQMCIEVEVDTSQAISALKHLQAYALKATVALTEADELASQLKQKHEHSIVFESSDLLGRINLETDRLGRVCGQ